jgi:hypothetical protein
MTAALPLKCIVLYLFTYLFVYLFIYLFICLFIYLFICLFIYLFICLFIYLFIYLFTYLFVYLFIYLFIYWFVLILLTDPRNFYFVCVWKGTDLIGCWAEVLRDDSCCEKQGVLQADTRS